MLNLLINSFRWSLALSLSLSLSLWSDISHISYYLIVCTSKSVLIYESVLCNTLYSEWFISVSHSYYSTHFNYTLHLLSKSVSYHYTRNAYSDEVVTTLGNLFILFTFLSPKLRHRAEIGYVGSKVRRNILPASPGLNRPDYNMLSKLEY
jgi:hypothetical protein